MDIIGGYMLIAERKTLWVSEEFDFSAYNLANRQWSFEAPITMVKAVTDGVWIGTVKRTYFVAGTEPEKWHITKEIPYGVKDGAVNQDLISAFKLSLENVDGEGALWFSHRGVCWGGSGGVLVDLVEPTLNPNPFLGGFGAVLEYNRRGIFTIEP